MTHCFGMAAPGAAVGKIAFNNAQAVEAANEGVKTVLVRRARLTPTTCLAWSPPRAFTRGGKTRIAAVVARGM